MIIPKEVCQFKLKIKEENNWFDIVNLFLFLFFYFKLE